MKLQVHKDKVFKEKIWNAIFKKKSLGWVGFPKSYIIFRVGHGKCSRRLTRWVGGVKKGQKYAYVIFEWSLTIFLDFLFCF